MSLLCRGRVLCQECITMLARRRNEKLLRSLQT